MRRKQQVNVVSHQTMNGQDSQIFVLACLADQERIDSLLRGKNTRSDYCRVELCAREFQQWRGELFLAQSHSLHLRLLPTA
jgi:hypothetical protein